MITGSKPLFRYLSDLFRNIIGNPLVEQMKLSWCRYRLQEIVDKATQDPKNGYQSCNEMIEKVESLLVLTGIISGKSPSNDIYREFQKSTVSREHCEIFIDDDNIIFLTDLNSTNGTFVNGTKINTQLCKKLDIVRAGNS